MSGRLFIIATPIGNLNDLSSRTVKALADSEIILAEDTRVSVKLLNHLQIKRKMYSCHDFNESQRLSLLDEVSGRDGSIALLSDAGTPLVSDPGFEIVQKAIQLNMTIIPVAGPSAFLLALIGSGLPCDRFVFEGFLPDKTGERLKRLEHLKSDDRTIVLYVAPHDFKRITQELVTVFGNRQACLARELTKLHEEFVRGTLFKLNERFKDEKPRGECVLVVAGAGGGTTPQAGRESVLKALSLLLDNGEGLKNASSLIAGETGWSKSEVYKLGIEYLESSKSQD